MLIILYDERYGVNIFWHIKKVKTVVMKKVSDVHTSLILVWYTNLGMQITIAAACR